MMELGYFSSFPCQEVDLEIDIEVRRMSIHMAVCGLSSSVKEACAASEGVDIHGLALFG